MGYWNDTDFTHAKDEGDCKGGDDCRDGGGDEG